MVTPIKVQVEPRTVMSDLDLQEVASDHTANVTTGSTQVLQVSKYRSSAVFVNDSDVVIYLRLGSDAALNSGIRLNAAGGSYEITRQNLFKGPVSAIHGGTGNKVLCIQQVTSRYAD